MPLLTLRRLTVALVALCVGSLFATAAQAQVVRPSESIYLLLRGSLATYTGDLDSDPTNSAFNLGDGFDDPGFGVGGELGYLFSDNLSFGLGLIYQDLPALNDGDIGGAINVQGGEAYQIQGLFRYLPFASSRIAPFLELGGALVFGQGTENERGGEGDGDVTGYGPVVGLGLDIALTPRLGLFLGAQSTVVFPDVALDGADPGAFGLTDDSDFDVLTNLGGGLRFAFRSPVRAPEITDLECPAELTTEDTGSFLVMADGDDATTTWEWGDGTTGSGRTAVHRFSAPGAYTVTATSVNQGGRDSDTCVVNVVERGEAPVLAGCRATLASADIGEAVTFQASATDADEIYIDFGDGAMASELPVSHAFRESGTYRVTITASNAYGEDTCTVTVTVGDAYCQGVSELSAVSFDYGAAALTFDASTRLDETIEILRRCPDLCVTINGYSDGAEPGDAMRVSQARANAVRDYYVAQGIDTSRLRAVGRGVDPSSNPKEDPGQGDRLGRRVDSIPTSCAGF